MESVQALEMEVVRVVVGLAVCVGIPGSFFGFDDYWCFKKSVHQGFMR